MLRKIYESKAMIEFVRYLGQGDKECIQEFVGKSNWKTSNEKTKTVMGGNNKLDLIGICLRMEGGWNWLRLCQKLFRYTPWRHLGGQEVQFPLFLNLRTRRGRVVSITPRPCFTPGERTPDTHCTGGWVGPRASLDTEGRGKILCLHQGSNPSRSVHNQSLY
jgi:hypothetical protein